MVKEFDFSSFNGKSVLITGGFGLTGNNLARRLVSLGAKVTLLTKSLRNENNVEDINKAVGVILGDIVDYGFIERVVIEKDYIFLLAGQTSVPKSMEDPFLDLEVNCKATLNVLESCRKNNPNVKIVFAGTVREVGPIKGSILREEFRENPVSLFDLHKLTSEKYLQIYHRIY